MDIDQHAPAITREEIFIAAPLKTVWNLFTDFSEKNPHVHAVIKSTEETRGKE